MLAAAGRKILQTRLFTLTTAVRSLKTDSSYEVAVGSLSVKAAGGKQMQALQIATGMQAKALAKDATDGGTLRQSAAHLPLVLMSEKGSSTDDVWRGIEVGGRGCA